MNPSKPFAKHPCPCGSGKPFRRCCGKALSPVQRALHRPAPATRWITLPDGRTLTPEQTLQEGIGLHRAGRTKRAADVYRALLAAIPEHADALHLLGVTQRQLGQLDDAVKFICRAIDLSPDVALFHSNLAEAYRAGNRGAEAEAAARRAVALDTRLPEAYLNLGAALHLQQRYSAAIEAYRQALALRPDYVDAQLGIGDALMVDRNYEAALILYRALLERQPDNRGILSRIGMTLRRAKRSDEAIRHYQDCVARHPDNAEYHNNLAHLYMQAGRKNEAATGLRRVLELTPDDIAARHLLDALEGKTTERAPADYVRELFDQYADTFESHLVQKLAYRTPQLLGDVLAEHIGRARNLSILDLGCGTGLMGEVLRDIGGRLVGVDISPKMVEKTLAKGLYEEAYADDLLAFMQRSPAASYDLIVAADVFVYLGELREIFRESLRLLRPGGWYAFTVEAADEENAAGFVLDITGRYRHHADYLHRLARAAGFTQVHFSRAVIRTQSDQPVAGYLCVYRTAHLPP